MRPLSVGSKVRSIVCLAATLLVLPMPLSAAATAPGLGSYAPPLELTDLGGTAKSVTWGDGTPAATVVYFFDPQSSACLLEMSFLDALYLQARDFGLAVYAVEAGGRQPAEVSRSMERYCTVYRDPSFPVLPDPAFRASRTYGAERVPVTFIMESHGVILNRIEGYDHDAAVTIARRLEQLLRRERGFLSPSVRESGISEAEEQAAEARLAAAVARASAPAARALGVGDRAPDFEFVDLAGLAGRWRWSGDQASGPRIVVFFGGLSLDSVAALNWLDALARRGRESGLEVLAIEAGGMGTAELQAAIDRYRRYNPEPSFPVAADPGGLLAKSFGPWERLPQTYLLAGNGSVIYHAEGFSTGEGEIIAGKVERAYLVAGRPFPPARTDGTAAPAPVFGEEEAPSIRKRQDLDDRYRSAIVQGDAAFIAWEFDRALPHYLVALEAQPKDLHALVRVAQIYERRGEPGTALEYWRRVLAVRPDHAEAASRIKEMQQLR
jgi:tetratricopeptide (TPR) repeat protein